MADAPSPRTQVKRLPERGRYDRETIDAILDEALICHLAWIQDGSPRIIPTIHARDGDTLYVHGSQASRTLRAARDGAEVCVEVTLLDALVLARSAFHSSMNYRCAIVYGRAREISDRDEKWHAQKVLVDHVVHGRSEHVRMPNERELKQTMILAIPLDEASAKVRTGPSKEDEEDYDLPIWAGVLPLRFETGEPEPDPRLRGGLTPPENVTDYRR